MFALIQKTVTNLQANVWYAILIVLLACTSVGMLGYEFTPNTNPELVLLFQQIDILIAVIFLADFFLGFFFNTHFSRKEFFKQNWLNLASSIPITSDITRALRILRILRAFRIIRAGMNFWFAESRLKRNFSKSK